MTSIYKFKQLIRDLFLYFGNPFNLFSFSPQHMKLIEFGPFDCVLHIGADIGQELSLYKFIGVKRIIWVEPNKKSLSKLKRRAIFYPKIQHDFVKALVSDTTGQSVTFYKFNKTGASSMFEPTQDFLKSNHKRYISKTETYMTSTIVDALGQETIIRGRNNLLVIDTQCSEYKILKSFPRELILKFRILMCEISVDQYIVDYTTDELLEQINRLGYKQVLAPIRKSDDAIFRLDIGS
jgi:FkbM family methyltransferase